LKAALWIAVLAAGWVVFCLVDLVRARQVRYLPKWGWAILCAGIGLTIPFGGILYLAVGKVRSPKPTRAGQRLARSGWGGAGPAGC
jgi:hypothetical protein